MARAVLCVQSVAQVARRGGQIVEIDGLRGIAILLVMFHHFWPVGGPLARGAQLAHLGWIGVDLFYVVSGYLISGILLDTRGEATYARNYLARRVLRVFPLYYLFLVLAFVGIPALQHGAWQHSEFVQQSGSPAWYALYIGNLRESILGHEPAYVLAPLWSLSIEEQFYLTFPFLVAWTSRETLRRVLLALIAFAPLFRIAMLLAVPGNERIQYLCTPSRVDVLALGCLLAVYQRSPSAELSPRGRTWLARGALAAVGAVALAFALGGLDRYTWFCRSAGYSLVGGTMCLVVWWALEHRGATPTRVLRWLPLAALGRICYGVYLLQRPAEIILGKTLGHFGVSPDPGSIAFMFGKCAAAIALAIASWHAFEKPVLRLKRFFVSSHHPLIAVAQRARV